MCLIKGCSDVHYNIVTVQTDMKREGDFHSDGGHVVVEKNVNVISYKTTVVSK